MSQSQRSSLTATGPITTSIKPENGHKATHTTPATGQVTGHDNLELGIGSAPSPSPHRGAGEKQHHSHDLVEHQNSLNLGLSKEVEGVLKDNWAFVKSRDEHGNYLIKSLPGDPGNPRSWKNWKRYSLVGLASLLNNLLGFAVGPMFLAPLSEYWGRRPVYLVSWTIFTIFQIPLALAQNLATVLVCRFIQGVAGSTPLANTGGVVHDLFGVDEGALAVGIYALSSADGPPLGNALSGFLAQEQGWRWLFWAYLIIFGFFLFIIFFFLPETRDTIILSRKSAKIRQETKDMPFFAEHELVKKDPSHLYKVTIVRPFKFLFTEPITYLCAGINGFAFGMIFLSNEAFPLVFGGGNGGHGWTHSGVVNLTFLAYVVGAFLGFALTPLQDAKYQAACRRRGFSDPEARWWSALWATPFMPIGLMIAAWTSYAHVPWIAPIIGLTLFGFGFYIILAAILNYVVDGYGHYSASALGGVVFVRNIVGAIFPLFARQMFVGMGNQWALFLLSMLSIGLVPIPFYLYYRGKTVREKSPYCATHFGKE
ncbi:polyamine transporter [Kwoniella heveanensis BCC8398]|uniref:Polyamine transporter n=1 Tax=Kwoniella heveanensis BCC8398 TaxID=1296120 RepID=A0A1B9GYX8_9TREE|nr:polyamine transporter [Kwoniella heveanensis BCC8398]